MNPFQLQLVMDADGTTLREQAIKDVQTSPRSDFIRGYAWYVLNTALPAYPSERISVLTFEEAARKDGEK